MKNDTVKKGEAATSLRYKMMELAASIDDVISLGRGDPDLDTPRNIWEGALKKLQQRHASSPVRGLPELREAIALRYQAEKGLNFDPEREIIITNGGKQALYNAFFTLQPGEIIIPTPYWLSYPEQINATNNTPIYAETDNSQIKADLIAEKITGLSKGDSMAPRSSPLFLEIPVNLILPSLYRLICDLRFDGITKNIAYNFKYIPI